jgi:hypothetical protein
VNGIPFDGVLLKSLLDRDERDTILIFRDEAFLAQLPQNVNQTAKRFKQWAGRKQREWGFGNTGTLKRIERLALTKSIAGNSKLRPVAYHYGAVPVLTVAEINQAGQPLYIAVLPSLADLKPENKILYKRELLLSFKRHLPRLFLAYYEQVGYYLRAIFFGADDEHVIKYAHRIRSILKGSIREKIIEIDSDAIGENKILADDIRSAYRRDIHIAQAVDAFGHLLTNYIYSFYCIKNDVAKYEERLSSITFEEGVFGAEHPVSFFRECVRHISDPYCNDVFISKVNNLATPWLIPFGEAAALIGEIKRSRQKGFAAPSVFVGYHFDIEANEQKFEQLQIAIQEHWPHVQLLRGQHLARNIRWSLLGRVWVADAYLFLIPPTFITLDGTSKSLNPKEDWLLLEFVYTSLLGKCLATMQPSALDSAVFEKFKLQVNGYAPNHEITQVSALHWEAAVKEAKSKWLKVLREVTRLPSLDPLDAQSLASFEKGVLDPLHRNLVEVFFSAAYWFLSDDALVILQLLLEKCDFGKGQIERAQLRQSYNERKRKVRFADAMRDLLDFSFHLFDQEQKLVIESNDRRITLRMAEIIELLCKHFGCHPQNINEYVITRMQSRRGG